MDVESNSNLEASSHSSQNNILVCNLCSVTFTRKNNLRSHEKKFHNISHAKCNQACPLCDEKCRTINDLHKHIEIQHHDVKLHFEEKIFYQESDFNMWKAEFERETVSSFVVSFTEDKGTYKVRHYRCHRSGAPEVKQGLKKKHAKYTGSIKIGVTCPAFIKVTNEDSTIIVKYQSTHVGHKCDVGKLPLQKEDRLNIASMLSSGLPINVVLDRTQAEFSPTKRVSLTTRQDIYNVARDFNVNNAAHKDDLLAVDITVKKMMQEDDNPVLLYKPRGQKLDDYPQIEEDEFLLGYSTEAQIELLNLYGRQCIMLDSTHGTNQHKYQLTTVMVHDPNHEGLPVAILFSTKCTAETMRPFFNAIRSKVLDFETKVLMTDDTTTYLNAWKSVFNHTPFHILCSWHVMTNFNRNLNTKVKCNERRELMKKDLKEILHEMDVTTFETYAENFIQKYKEEDSFISYFKGYYLTRKEKWAYCFRKGFGINTNMKLERWHRQIKYEECGGVIMNRLDKSLNIILRAMSRKLLNRVITIKRGKLTKRVQLIRNRHAESQRMLSNKYSALDMGEGQYVVFKVEKENIFTYEIRKEDMTCKCSTSCIECKICIHSMSCSCIDFNVKYLICKHIHFVCKKFTITSENQVFPSSSTENLNIDVTEEEIAESTEERIICHQLKRKNTDPDEERSQCKTLMDSLYERMKGLESADCFQYFKENLRNMHAYIDVMENSQKFETEISKTAPPNKKICPQKRY